MTADEFNSIQIGDVLLNYDGMRNWTVTGREGQTLIIQTTRTLSNSVNCDLEGWIITRGDSSQIVPPPF